MALVFNETSLEDCFLIKPKVFADDRGFFCETFRLEQIEAFLNRRLIFVQENLSHSKKHVLRGLHYQEPLAQGKLIQVVQGEIFDVCVDMRRSSLSFGKWIGIYLSFQKPELLWIPEGFAHGFLVLSETAALLYKTTEYYAPLHEKCLLWNDPTLAINWPLTAPPILSPKDKKGLLFTNS